MPRLASSSAVNAPPSVPFAAGTSSVAAFPLSDGAPRTKQSDSSSKQSELEEEATMLSRARSEVRDGKLSEAFATLEAAREKFSLPELRQEREALLIELLYRSGQRATAVERAKGFLIRYPKSPHTVQVRTIANSEPR